MFRSVALLAVFLFVPSELSRGGHGGSARLATSWRFVAFILASPHWPLTQQCHASPALAGCHSQACETSERACS